MSFQIHALSETPFVDLFALSDADLARKSAKRVVADAKPGFPCRVSLADAEVGDTVLLVNHQHQPHATPYQASHAIFVRQGITQANPDRCEIPDVLKTRLLSVRGFNGAHYMIDADVAQDDNIEKTIRRMFKDPDIDYVHLHNAKQGCFAASVTRA